MGQVEMRSRREKGRGIVYSLRKLLPNSHIAGAKRSCAIWFSRAPAGSGGWVSLEMIVGMCYGDEAKQALTMITTFLDH